MVQDDPINSYIDHTVIYFADEIQTPIKEARLVCALCLLKAQAKRVHAKEFSLCRIEGLEQHEALEELKSFKTRFGAKTLVFKTVSPTESPSPRAERRRHGVASPAQSGRRPHPPAPPRPGGRRPQDRASSLDSDVQG